ncbi:MAG: IclR family transcriptional regulator [Proteobacteria bacterium]|nr:IclR family transcriptional regulator [Pseudomonadota bacterium]
MYSPPILKKSLEVLKFIVDSGTPLGVTEISNNLSVSKSTVYGILNALKDEKFVEKEIKTKKYLIGPELYELAKKVFRGGEILMVARPFLKKLVSLVDETAFLCIRENTVARVLDAVEAKKALKISSPIGLKFPITASVLCKAFLSPMDNESIKMFLKEKGLPRYTENSITDINEFLKEIDKTREAGYSLDLEEYLKGVRAVATLIYSNDLPIGAICVIGFSNSMLNDKLPFMIQQLKNTTQQISERLSQLKIQL